MLAEKLGGTRVTFVYLGMKQSACTMPTEVAGIGTRVFCIGAISGVILEGYVGVSGYGTEWI